MTFRHFFYCLLCLPVFLQAQYSEVGIAVGASAYEGDLTSTQFGAAFRHPRVALGAFYRYNAMDFVSVKLGFTYGTLAGDDSKSGDAYQRGRNLHFKSSVMELALTGEFNILGYQPYNLDRPFSPYVFGGIAVFRFNPKALYQDEWIALQPLGTEGQGLSEYPERKMYNLTSFAIPCGVGAKYALNDTWNVGFEAGIRFTFTDYLDDVSTTYADENVLLVSRERWQRPYRTNQRATRPTLPARPAATPAIMTGTTW